jgi:high affinity sulfate transporter 1
MSLDGERARFPGIEQIRHYRRGYATGDIVAGLLVAALAVPQALGYATVAGVPVQVGLYTLPPALLAYALLGSSRLLFVGPVSTVTVLSGTIVRQLAGGDLEHAAELTSALAIVAGVVLLVAGLIRIGWVAQFLSEPIVTGFVTGLVVLVVVGELPGLLGLPSPNGALLDRLVALVRTAPDAHPTTLAVALVALVLLFGGQRLAPVVPWSLIVLVGGILVSDLADLAGHGARVVGTVPAGLPLPSLPRIGLSELGSLVTGGIAVAAVGIAEGLAAARTFAGSSRREKLHDDTELVANGVADIAAGLFGGMGVAGSLSKTAANARAGARTQMSSLVSAVTVLLVLLFATGLLAPLPRAVLSAIVIHAVWGLLHPKEFARFRAVRRNDGIAALVALGGVLVLGPLNGLLLAVGQSLAGLIYRSMQVHIDEMGKVPGEKAAWGSIANDPHRKVVKRICVLRPDGPIFWANAAAVFERIRAGIETRPDARAVILDLEATNQMDTTTAERLHDLLGELRARDIELYLVRVFGNVRGVLERAGVMADLGDEHTWHSISAGVRAAKHTPAFVAARAAEVAAAAAEGIQELEPDTDDSADDGGDGADEHIASRWSPREALGAVRGAFSRDRE